MRKFILAAVAMSGLCFGAATLNAEDAKDAGKDDGVAGVLIDNTCGANMKGEDDAAEHPKACAMKDGCAKAGYAIMHGDKLIKLDEAGNKLAKEYLAKEEHTTKVHVAGKVSEDGMTIAVEAIHPQEAAK